jgi:hypothetical protein
MRPDARVLSGDCRGVFSAHGPRARDVEARCGNRVEYPSTALMLKRLMMHMRSDFGLPIGTEHAHHQPLDVKWDPRGMRRYGQQIP